jgi:hypothetical protein
MDIVVETRTARRIPNGQEFDVAPHERNMATDLPRQFPFPCVYRTAINPIYNCHGLTFASRRTWIYDADSIRNILQDDCYDRIAKEADVLPGDIVLYVTADGDIEHSGIVVSRASQFAPPTVCSKWGKAAEVVHLASTSPYRGTCVYYRVNR